MECPICCSQNFYVKSPDDEYETWDFECREGKICFDSGIDESQAPKIQEETETFCQRCSWHGKFNTLKTG